MNDLLTYNYYCLNTDCKTNHILHITKAIDLESRQEHCKDCDSVLKLVGIKTSITHKGTQEAMNKMKR